MEAEHEALPILCVCWCSFVASSPPQCSATRLNCLDTQLGGWVARNPHGWKYLTEVNHRRVEDVSNKTNRSLFMLKDE